MKRFIGAVFAAALGLSLAATAEAQGTCADLRDTDCPWGVTPTATKDTIKVSWTDQLDGANKWQIEVGAGGRTHLVNIQDAVIWSGGAQRLTYKTVTREDVKKGEAKTVSASYQCEETPVTDVHVGKWMAVCIVTAQTATVTKSAKPYMIVSGVVDGLTILPDTAYTIRMRAFREDAAGVIIARSGWSDTRTVRTKRRAQAQQGAGPLAKPTNLRAVWTTDGNLRVTWSATTSTPSASDRHIFYRVEGCHKADGCSLDAEPAPKGGWHQYRQCTPGQTSCGGVGADTSLTVHAEDGEFKLAPGLSLRLRASEADKRGTGGTLNTNIGRHSDWTEVTAPAFPADWYRVRNIKSVVTNDYARISWEPPRVTSGASKSLGGFFSVPRRVSYDILVKTDGGTRTDGGACGSDAHIYFDSRYGRSSTVRKGSLKPGCKYRVEIKAVYNTSITGIAAILGDLGDSKGTHRAVGVASHNFDFTEPQRDLVLKIDGEALEDGASVAVTEGDRLTFTAYIGGAAPEHGLRINVAATGTAGSVASCSTGTGHDWGPGFGCAGDIESTNIHIAPGANSGSIPIRIIQDGQKDPDETLVLTASYSIRGEAASRTVTLEIEDVWHPNRLSVQSDTSYEPLPAQNGEPTSYAPGVPTDGPPVEFVVVLDPPSEETVTVDYATQDGYGSILGGSWALATADEDYRVTSGTLTFAPGETRKYIHVPVIDDEHEDSGEIFRMVLSNPTNAMITHPQAIGLILNDEADPEPDPEPTPVAVSLSATPNPVSEGSPVTVRATLAEALSEAVTIPLTVTRGTSEDGDHGSLASIEIPAGGTSATGTISTTDDADGDDETFTVALGSLPSGLTAGPASSVEVTITDSGVPQQQQRTEPLTAVFDNMPSGHDGTAFTFDVTLSDTPGASKQPVAASFKVAPGKASVSGSGTRYTVSVTPKAANAWKDVTVTLAGGRACSEEGAVCTADGRALTNTSSVTVTGPVRIRVAGAKAREAPGAVLEFAVTLNRPAAHAVSVDYATEDGTAKAGADYTAVSGTLIFAAGETASVVRVPVLDDAVDEGKEAMRLKLSNPQGAYLRGVHSKAKGVIRNADPLQAAWLARFGRMVAGQTVDALSARFAMPSDAPGHAVVGGMDLAAATGGPGMGAALETLGRTLAGPDGADLSSLLPGSSFRFAAGDALAPGGAVTGWGRVVAGGSDGTSGGLSFSGSATTAMLSMDRERGRLLVGLALSRSVETGEVRDSGGLSYRTAGELALVAPYMRFRAGERLSFWSAAGTGEGSMTLSWAGASHKAPVSMRLVAVGGRAELARPGPGGGLALALRTDAFLVQVESAGAASAAGRLASARGEARRVRAVLEGSRTFALASGGRLEPSLSLGLRHDAGDAGARRGIETGAGLSWAAVGLEADLRLYGITSDGRSGLREWGASGSLRKAPDAHGRGLSLSVAPSWGAPERTGHLRRAETAGAGTEASVTGARLDSRAGYGLMLPGGLTGTPWAGMGLGPDGARDWRLGWRLEASGGLSLGIEASRLEVGGGAPADKGLMLSAAARW